MVAFENMNEVEQGMAVVKCQWLCNPNLPTLAVMQRCFLTVCSMTQFLYMYILQNLNLELSTKYLFNHMYNLYI